MYFSEDTNKALASFSREYENFDSLAQDLARLKKKQEMARKRTGFLAKNWAQAVTVPRLENKIKKWERQLVRFRENLLERAEVALLMMGRELVDNDPQLRGRYADMWQTYEQTRFFARLGERLAMAAKRIDAAIEAVNGSDIYLAPGQTPRRILSLSEARGCVYDAAEEVIRLQYHLNDRGGQNMGVNAIFKNAEKKFPMMRKAMDALWEIKPEKPALTSPNDVEDMMAALSKVQSAVAMMRGFFAKEIDEATRQHDEQARAVQKAFLLEAVSTALKASPKTGYVPQKLANALEMNAKAGACAQGQSCQRKAKTALVAK